MHQSLPWAHPQFYQWIYRVCPRGSVDWRIEVAVHKAFEAAARDLQASVASSLFAGVIFLWIQELMKCFSILEEARKGIKEMLSAAAFISDATSDSMQLSAHAMAASIMALRSTEL